MKGITKVVDTLQSGLPEDISRYFGMLSQKNKKAQKGYQKKAQSSKIANETINTSADIVRSVMSGAPTPIEGTSFTKSLPTRKKEYTKNTQKTNRAIQRTSSTQTKRVAFKSAEDIKRHAIAEYSGPICPYCQKRAEIKTAKEHTGRDETYCYWVCPSCTNVSVTTYGKTYHPAGILADAETRRFRSEVQKLIRFKKSEYNNDRFKLNEWIQSTLDVEAERAWIGQLSKSQLSHLARAAQKEQFSKNYSHIFR